MKKLINLIIVLLSLAAMLNSAGCASEQNQPVPGANSGIAAPLLSQLPPLPSGKHSSAAIFLSIDGNSTFERSPNAIVAGSALQLLSGTGDLSWGIWEFSPGLEYLQSIQVDINIPAGDEAYVALSDYVSGRWKIKGPLLADGTYTYPVDEIYRSAAGNFYVAVITADGSSATVNEHMLETNEGWVIVTVAEAEGALIYGAYASLAVVSGKPAISYQDPTYGDLVYAGCTTTTGSNASDWWTYTVDSAGDVGAYTSMAVVAGQPAISYQDTTNQDLKYARRDISQLFWEIVTVDSSKIGENVGSHTSLAVVNNRPYISYYDSSDKYVLYALSSTATGTSAGDWMTFVIDSQPDAGPYISMAELDNQAAVSYRDSNNGDLKYKWFANPAVTVVDSSGNVGDDNSIAVVNGRPAISYYDGTNWDLKYAISTTASGANATDWIKVVIDSGGDVGLYTTLALVAGRPAIGYRDFTNTSLKFAWSRTLTGADASDWDSITIDPDLLTSDYISLAEVDGKPALSYYNSNTGDLKYAIRMGP